MAKSSKPVSVERVRSKLSLSQAEFAALVGAHAMTVSKWERGVARPSPHQRRLIEAFELAAKRGRPLPPALDRDDPIALLAHLLGTAHEAPDADLGLLSATNRLPGVVVELTRGEVMSKVVIEIAPKVRIGAVITTDSVDRLRLRKGSHASAIVKATEVIVGVPSR